MKQFNCWKELRINQTGSLFYKDGGFKGLILGCLSLKNIYTDYVESGKMDSISTRSLNQDALENFFGRIRSCNGSNTNPTVEQFCGAYQKTIVSVELTCSSISNCVDQLSILHIPSTHSAKTIADPVIVRVDDTNERKKPSSKKKQKQTLLTSNQ